MTATIAERFLVCPYCGSSLESKVSKRGDETNTSYRMVEGIACDSNTCQARWDNSGVPIQVGKKAVPNIVFGL